MESDYIFRNEFLEDIISVLDASPFTIGLTGEHPDMYDQPKYSSEFPRIMEKEFGYDIRGRENFYRKITFDTKRGPIDAIPVTNSCGCHFLYYERLMGILEDLDNWREPFWNSHTFWKFITKACDGTGDGSKYSASDGILSSTYTLFHYRWAQKKGLDLTKNFPWLAILPSISLHLNALGRNGMLEGVSEGQTFTPSPSFPEKWETWERNPKPIVEIPPVVTTSTIQNV